MLHLGIFLSLWCLAEHELLLELLQELRTSLDINEEGVDFTDVWHVDLGALSLLRDSASFPLFGRDDEVLFDDAGDFELDIHNSLQERINDLISIAIKLIINCIELIVHTSCLFAHLFGLRLEFVLLRKSLLILGLLNHINSLLRGSLRIL